MPFKSFLKSPLTRKNKQSKDDEVLLNGGYTSTSYSADTTQSLDKYNSLEESTVSNPYFTTDPKNPNNAKTLSASSLYTDSSSANLVKNSQPNGFNYESPPSTPSLELSNTTNQGPSSKTGSSEATINRSNDLKILLKSGLDPESSHPMLAPIINLINCHKIRTYGMGIFNIAGNVRGEKVWIEVEAKLTGNELSFWRPDDSNLVSSINDASKPKRINLTDTKVSKINLQLYEVSLVYDYQAANFVNIKFNSKIDLTKWLSAIQLSKYEYNALCEAYTAVMISLKASKFSDIKVLLSPKKHFVKLEWINLRLPQIINKWLKVFMIITPSDAKHRGRIEIYKNETINPKNLIAYSAELTSAFNVFPEQTSMIDFNSIMKLQGQIFVNKSYEHFFHPDDSEVYQKRRSFSMKSNNLQASQKGHRRTTSENYESSNSFFTSAPNVLTTPPLSPPSLSPQSSSFRLRKPKAQNPSEILGAKSKTSVYINKRPDQFVSADCMYVMPIPHPGVSTIETMIRNLIYIFDAFKLYGRPRHLISDKLDPKSLLFGLPSLPRYQYLSNEESFKIVESCLKNHNSNHGINWKIVFDTSLERRMKNGYKGEGDIGRLYSGLDYNSFNQISNSITSPKVVFPRGESPTESNLDLNENPSYQNEYGIHSSTHTPNFNNNQLADPIDFSHRFNSNAVRTPQRVR